VLFSDPDISVRLNGPRFANLPPAHRIDLKGLSEADTAGYLQQRMQAAGLAGALPLDSGDLRHIYRASHGIPGLINQQAHQLLQHRHQRRIGGTHRQAVKLGIAATAVIGTVLGLQGRVIEMLGGDSQAVSVGGVERPVIRLSEAAQPWAVVIRDGESIQISCGASGPDTVGVRPTLSTAALSQSSSIISRPMLAATQATMVSDDEVAEAVAIDTEVDPPEERVEDAPLVVAAASATDSEEKIEPLPLQLERVEPNLVIARPQVQRLLVHGQGFVDGSRIALSRAGQVEVLPDEQVTVLDNNTLAIEIETGDSTAGWAIQLSSPDDRRSNVLRFQVVSQQRLPSEQTALVSSQPSENKQTPPVNVATTPATPVKPEINSTSKTEKTSAAQQVTATSGLLDTRWLASQPAENFTVQLFASAEHETIKKLVAQGGLPQPLAEFAMQRDGKPLYVLTHGSYPDRAAAERASAGLEGGIQAWIRSIGSVQEVMEAVSAPAAASSPVPAVDAALSGIKDDAWVWSQNPAHHTIQLAAASSEQAISEAMAGMTLPGERVVVKTMRNGQPWFVLIYGTFADKAAAKNTIDRLPTAQRNAGPWTRSFASLQDEMSRSNR
jgi:septal ring-binding cell division protein DamX